MAQKLFNPSAEQGCDGVDSYCVIDYIADGHHAFGMCKGDASHRCRPFQALVRTLYVSGAFAAADTLLKVAIIFGMHVPLFLYGCAHGLSVP